jgi:hypothetical protein
MFHATSGRKTGKRVIRDGAQGQSRFVAGMSNPPDQIPRFNSRFYNPPLDHFEHILNTGLSQPQPILAPVLNVLEVANRGPFADNLGPPDNLGALGATGA